MRDKFSRDMEPLVPKLGRLGREVAQLRSLAETAGGPINDRVARLAEIVGELAEAVGELSEHDRDARDLERWSRD